MKLPQPLFAGRLVRRYQRFLADIELHNGQVVTAYTPNTGSMRQCSEPGIQVQLSQSDNPQRKLAWTWELVKVNSSWVDINTHRANRVVEESLKANRVAGLQGFSVRPEHTYARSRFDFILESHHAKVLLEVKNVTLCCHDRTACFPDAVTVRGHKHLEDLMLAAHEGYRAVLFFLVQRAEALAFQPADEIDPEYGRLLRKARVNGVELLAYRTQVTLQEVTLGAQIAVDVSC